MATGAQAQEAPLSMMLSCTGTDAVARQAGSTTVVTTTPGRDPGIGSAQHRASVIANTAGTAAATIPQYETVRVPARLSVAVEGSSVRVRPSENTRPGLGRKKSADGWYELSSAALTDTQIAGVAGYGGIFSGKYKLAIDRQTGDVRFGSFEGACEKSATGPTERKF